MWIHEVKIPVASLTLLIHNNKNMFDKRYIEQIRKLDNYIDQILYFVRSENAEKDYLIKEIELQKIIKDVALKNKDEVRKWKIKVMKKILESFELRLMELRIQLINWDNFLNIMQLLIFNNCV